MQVQKQAFVLIALAWMILLALSPAPAQKSAEEIQDHMEAAQRYMANEQWDYAGYEWRNILAIEPDNLQANLGLAEVLIQSGFLPDAIKQLQNVRKRTKQPLLDRSLAKAYEKTGKLQPAALLYRDLLLEDPLDDLAFTGLKNIAPKLPKRQKSIVRKFLAEEGKQAKVRAQKAMSNGQYAKAAREYRIASIFYNRPSVANDYALALFLSGDKQAAAQQFNFILKRAKEHCRIKANAALVALSLGNHAGAQSLMERSIALCSEPALKSRLYNNLGYIYEMGKKWSQAQFAYERAIELEPGNTKASMNRGYLYQRGQAYDQAIAFYKGFLQRDPSNAEAWNQLGFAYEMQDQFKPAIEAYNKAIALNPGLKEAYFNLGMLYKKDDKLDKANLLFKQIQSLEFAAMESAHHSAKVNHSPLLKYVDLFFFEPVL